MSITTLAHHIDVDWLREAHKRTRKDGAKGVDGQSAADYAGDLEGNLGADPDLQWPHAARFAGLASWVRAGSG